MYQTALLAFQICLLWQIPEKRRRQTKSNCFLLVYDVTDLDRWSNMNIWYHEEGPRCQSKSVLSFSAWIWASKCAFFFKKKKYYLAIKSVRRFVYLDFLPFYGNQLKLKAHWNALCCATLLNYDPAMLVFFKKNIFNFMKTPKFLILFFIIFY